MSQVASGCIDLLIDLDHPSINWQSLHHGLEALDAAGFVPHHLLTLPGGILARIEMELGSTLGAQVDGGGAWLIERKASNAPSLTCGEAVLASGIPLSTGPYIGMAGYLGRQQQSKDAEKVILQQADVGVGGPFSLEKDLAPHRLTLTSAVLHSLRERGYRKAVLLNIKTSSLSALREHLGTAILSVMPRPELPTPRVVVCASGQGSNLQAVIDAVAAGSLDLDLRKVIINRHAAFAAERAQRAAIPAQCIVWQRDRQSREDFDQRIQDAIAEERPDLVLLLGWMHLLPSSFLQAFPEILNVHPAYLPLDRKADIVTLPDGSSQAAFRGVKCLEAATVAQARWVGASVHRVTDEIDRGEIVARRPLSCREGETLASLRKRVHEVEHGILLDALRRWLTLR